MDWKTAAATLLAATAMLGPASGTSASGPDAQASPRVLAFSPAAVHAGADFLIDAEFAGNRPPRVWVGPRRLPSSRVRVARDAGASEMRRIWGRVPARMPAGEHFLKIATRAGEAKAAQRIVVVACEPPVPVVTPDCDGVIPDFGACLTITGDGGYSEVLQADLVETIAEFGRTSYITCTSSGLRLCFGLSIGTLDPDTIQVGTLTVDGMSYQEDLPTSSNYQFWWLPGASSVEVVEVSATRVKLRIDGVFDDPNDEAEPPQVTVKGYLVFAR